MSSLQGPLHLSIGLLKTWQLIDPGATYLEERERAGWQRTIEATKSFMTASELTITSAICYWSCKKH